jgi:hypothetical protein
MRVDCGAIQSMSGKTFSQNTSIPMMAAHVADTGTASFDPTRRAIREGDTDLRERVISSALDR